ncbi:acyl carrier protein [Tepidibacter sp. Z1-5]|uniref:acyl carrier protein n=1 Tax=Tepidibacter sp. Z1-5 TaxID=3134138 RepID=UPI0030BBF6D4
MKTIDIYNKIFIEVFEIDINKLNDDLKYNTISQWDSVGHMQLITELEESFDIMFDTDDIIDFNSYEKGKEILEKYNVKFNME